MKQKEIYLVFTRTGTWLSRVIGTFSEMEYVHASLSFDSSLSRMYSFGRTNPDNPFSGGFVEENLKGGVFKKFSDAKCSIYRIKVTPSQYAALQAEVERFQKEKEKYRYNLLGLIGVKVGIPIKRPYHYFCSQFVSELLMNSEIYDFLKEPELIGTDDLYALDNLEHLYEGYAATYGQSSCKDQAM